jgi:hypothetical protein
MTPLSQLIARSPVSVRVAPFVLFLALTFCQGRFGEASRYWFYLAKTLAGVWLVWGVMRPRVSEMRWALSWEAVATGIGVFGIWIGLDGLHPKLLSPDKPWNPHEWFAPDTGLAVLFVGVRLFGSTIVVPPLEEVFYRSFLYRYVTRSDFEAVPLAAFNLRAFVIVSAIFGLTHHEWLAGILCGFAYQALVCRKRRLGDAMTAHAITNLLLGLWVVWRGAWNFW